MAGYNRFNRRGLNGKAIAIAPQLEILPGARIDRSCDELAAVANALGRSVTAKHNGRMICADEGMSGKQVLDRFWAAHGGDDA